MMMRMVDRMEVQTRSEENGIRRFETIAEAFAHAELDETVWKVSFTHRGECFRFVRVEDGSWVNEPLPDFEEMVS